MAEFMNVSGLKFSRLRAINFFKKRSNRTSKTMWACICDCGNKVNASISDLQQGKTKSCGCLNTDRIFKHGDCDTPEYQAWASMLSRCNNPKNKFYHRYGGRGIVVCDRWSSDCSDSAFQNFMEDMGKKPNPKASIERVNNNEGYNPSNCIWADSKTQAINKCNVKLYWYSGIKLCAKHWSKLLECHPATIRKYASMPPGSFHRFASERLEGISYG